MFTLTEYTVVIKSDGTASFFLHHDNHPLFVQENAIIIRASNVRFDNEDKLWYVWECLPDGLEKKLPKGFIIRSEAIAYEIEVLENEIANDPDYLEERFKTQVKTKSDL